MTKDNGIESWVRRIDNQEMPIFQASVSTIAQMAASDETSASELASTILRDPSLAVKTFFLTPIIVNNHPIGIFYADRQPSTRALDENSFASFEHLGQQAGISINYISHKSK